MMTEAVRSVCNSHGSPPVFEAAVVGFDPVVRVLLDVMPRRWQQFVEHPRVDRRLVGVTSTGVTFNVASARPKNRRAASLSRRSETRRSPGRRAR
jgi:hypothetical protein